MAPRSNWKGYLRLSLVSCPIAMYPATSEREKVRFHQINSETGNRVRMRRVDEGTDDEVPYEKIVSGYEVGKGQYIEITDEELEAIALESTRTMTLINSSPSLKSTNSTTFVRITSRRKARSGSAAKTTKGGTSGHEGHSSYIMCSPVPATLGV